MVAPQRPQRRSRASISARGLGGYGRSVLSVVRIPESAGDLVELGNHALTVLALRPGFVRGRLGRSTDEDGGWALVTEWESVGAWRRALSAYEVKVHATALLALAVDEPSAFEVLLSAEPGAEPERFASDRADGGSVRGSASS